MLERLEMQSGVALAAFPPTFLAVEFPIVVSVFFLVPLSPSGNQETKDLCRHF
jgi:hypothetical protein